MFLESMHAATKTQVALWKKAKLFSSMKQMCLFKAVNHVLMIDIKPPKCIQIVVHDSRQGVVAAVLSVHEST